MHVGDMRHLDGLAESRDGDVALHNLDMRGVKAGVEGECGGEDEEDLALNLRGERQRQSDQINGRDGE